MRTILSISLLIAYALVWLKPYSPYIEYSLNKEYIIETYCENKEAPEMHCDGKCHLAKQVKEAAESEESKLPYTPPTDVDEDLYELNDNTKPYHGANTLLSENYFKKKFDLANYSGDIPHPPPEA